MRDFSQAKAAKAAVEAADGRFVCHNRLTGMTSYFKRTAPNAFTATIGKVI